MTRRTKQWILSNIILVMLLSAMGYGWHYWKVTLPGEKAFQVAHADYSSVRAAQDMETAQVALDRASTATVTALHFRPDSAELIQLYAKLEQYQIALRLCKYARKTVLQDNLYDAEKLFEQAEAACPDFALVPYAWGCELQHKGHLNEAEMHFRRVIELQPQFTDALFRLADIVNATDPAQTVDLYQRIIASPKNSAMDYLLTSLAQIRLSHEPEALAALKQAAALAGNSDSDWYLLGRIYGQLKHCQDAVLAYHQAVRIAPNNEKYWIELVGTLRYYSRLAEANEQLNIALTHLPNSLALQMLQVRTLGELDQDDAAFSQCDRLIEQYSDDARPLAEKARLLQYRKRYDEALSLLQTALKSDPECEAALMYMGNCLTATDKLTAALPYYERLVKINPDSTENLHFLGMCQLQLEQYREAESSYQKLIGKSPQNALAYAMLGITCFRAKDFPKADANLQVAVRLDPNLSMAWFAWGELALAQSQTQLARDRFQKAYDLDPTNQKYSDLMHLLTDF